MCVKTWMKVAILVPALSLGVLTVRAQQAQSQQSTGDPVADAARKAREQKKEAPKPKKVYTDDDVKPASTPQTQPAANGTAAGAQGSSEGSKPADANGAGAADRGANGGKNDEATWRKKFQEQHDKIAQAEKELDLLQREGDKAEVQYYADPQKAMNEQLTRKDINDHNSKIEQKKQQIAQLKQQLDDMEDQLRKSGGDPGWAR